MKSLPISTLLLLGGIGVVVVIYFAMLNWRRAVHAALVVALFEGAIRKWIFPQASELVYFLKDIFLLGAYVKFYLFPDLDIRQRKLDIPATLIAAVCVMLILGGAFNPNIGSVILAIYGVKIYLWYVPLAFMMPYLFKDEEHMTRLIFRYSLFAIPIGVLGTMQFLAGVDSPLNVYAKSEYGDGGQVATFGSDAGRARITGTFSYISGLAVFVTVFFGMGMGLLSGLNDKRRWIMIFLVLPAIVALAFMTGSRSAVFSIVIIATCFILMSGVYRLGKGGNVISVLILAAGAVMMMTNIFFGDAYKAFESRRATTGDSTSERIMYPISSVMRAAKEVDITGYGIGMSHPASAGIRNGLGIPPPKRLCPVYDAETGQVLAELGWPAFLMWYMLRTMIVFDCWNAFRRSRPSVYRSLCLAFFCYQMIQLPSSVVLNHTANLFVFATWGFCLIPQLRLITFRSKRTVAARYNAPIRH